MWGAHPKASPCSQGRSPAESDYKSLLCLANEKVQVAKGEATSIAVRVVVEYNESNDFMNNATKARVDAYIVRFIDCKRKVAQNFPALDLNRILALEEEEEEEREVAKQEVSEADEETTEVLNWR